MKKSQKILFGVLCVFALAAILGITWMTASRVTSAQIYEELQAMPVTNKTSEISAYLDRFFIDDYDDEALARLPEQTRRIFEMSRFQGMTHQQIAAEMEVSPQTVNYHIGQALKVLGVALKDYLPLIALFFEMPGNN